MRPRITHWTPLLAAVASLAPVGPVVASLGAQTTAPASAPATPSPTPVRLAALDLTMALDYERQWIDGRAALTVENWTDRTVTDLPLLLGRLMHVDSVTDARGRALPFTQDVTVFQDWTLRQVTAASVRLPAPLAAHDSVLVTVHYAGHLVPATETGMRYVRDHLDPAFSVLRSESFAFPQLGTPSLAAVRAVPRRSFRFTGRVTVPDTLVVATGGEEVARRTEGGRTTYVLRGRRPIPFLNLPVAPYRVHESGGVRAYLLPADSARGPALLATVDRALAWLRDHYGDLPQAPRLSLMEIPDGWGSQAHLDAGIMIEASAITASEDWPALYHELSHLWNAPDAEAPSPRWNEGLATYLQDRMAAELDGADLDRTAAARAERLCRRAAASEAVRTTPLARYGETDMTGWSYSVGALFFHVLAGVMGPDRFDDAYRALYQATSTGHVSVDDLERTLTAADPRAAAVVEDWVRGVAWYPQLCQAHGARPAELVAAYRSR